MKVKINEVSDKYVRTKRSPYLKGEDQHVFNKATVAQLIIALNQSTKKLTLKSLGLNKRPKPDPLLTSIVGKNCSRKFLYHMACHHYSSWNSALETCQISPIKSPTKFWTSKIIIKVIQQLHIAKHPLTVKDIWRDRTKFTTKIIFESTGRKTTGSALHDAARRNLGSWDEALIKAGIKVQDVKEKPFWTRSKVISAISALHQEGIPLNSQSLEKDRTRKTKKIIEQKIGKGRTGQSLYGGAYRAFGSWDRALSEAGLETKKIRKTDFFWNKRSISRILRILHELEVPINSSSISKDTSQETKKIIYNYTGQIEPGTKLYHLGHKMIGRWDDVLRYSGFKLSHVRRSGTPCDKDPERILEYIRLFNKNEYPLSHTAVTRHSHFMKFLTEDHYGSPVSGVSLLKTAHGVFGSWDDALWKAGLDPSAIRLKSRPNTSALPVTPHQKEDILLNGERRYSRFSGAPAKSPEQILEEKESASELSLALKSLSQDEAKLAEDVFDAILQIHHYRDQEDLIKHIIIRMDQKITELEVKSIFSKIALTVKEQSIS